MRSILLALACVFALPACSSDPDVTPVTWQLVFDGDYLAKEAGIPGALLSVWGSSENDIWMVGGSQEATPTSAPIILNFNGVAWQKLVLPKVVGTFWWVTGHGDELWFAGTKGQVIRWNRTDRAFAREQIPNETQLWGILAYSGSDVWAVGGDAANCHDGLPCGVIWHYDGKTWTAPTGLPTGWNTTAWFKVFGRGPNDLFVCGMNGHILHWDGAKWLDEVPTAPDGSKIDPEKLLTGSCNGALCVAVGGEASGVIAEHDGKSWKRKILPAVDPLNGVWVNSDGTAIAVGAPSVGNGIWKRTADGAWAADATTPTVFQPYHATFVDPVGGIWAVGGDLFSFKTSQLAHSGSKSIPRPVAAAAP